MFKLRYKSQIYSVFQRTIAESAPQGKVSLGEKARRSGFFPSVAQRSGFFYRLRYTMSGIRIFIKSLWDF